MQTKAEHVVWQQITWNSYKDLATGQVLVFDKDRHSLLERFMIKFFNRCMAENNLDEFRAIAGRFGPVTVIPMGGESIYQ